MIEKINSLLDLIGELAYEENNIGILRAFEILDDLLEDSPPAVSLYYNELKDIINNSLYDCDDVLCTIDSIKVGIKTYQNIYNKSFEPYYGRDMTHDEQELINSLQTGELVDVFEDFDDIDVNEDEAIAFFEEEKQIINNALAYLLQKYFPNGIKVYEDSNITFIRDQARVDLNGLNINLSSKAIVARIQQISTLIDRGVWKYGKITFPISDNNRFNILSYLYQYKYDIVPIQAIFDKFKPIFVETGINNRYALQGQIKYWNLPFGYDRDYIYKSNDVSIYELIERFILEGDGYTTKEMIKAEFPGISDIVVQQANAYTNIVNMNGYYTHISKFDLSAQDILNWNSFLVNQISDNRIYHSKDLFTKGQQHIGGLLSKIGVIHYLQFFALSEKLFGNKFNMVRPYIAKKNVLIKSGEKQLIDKIIVLDKLAIFEIGQMAKRIGTQVDRYIDFINGLSDFVFLNRREIVKSSVVGIKKSCFGDLDELLDLFMSQENYKPVDQFTYYHRLPHINCNWNEWTLYSVILRYSKKYTVTTSSNVLQNARPYVVKKGFNVNEIEFESADTSTNDVEFVDINDEDILDYIDFDDLQ